VRIVVGYVPADKKKADGVLHITHGFDGKKVSQSFSAADLEKGAKKYTVAGAQKNEYITMELK
jgi:hypothetical protein